VTVRSGKCGVKFEKGVRSATVTYSFIQFHAKLISDFPAVYTVELAGKWHVIFGAEECASDATLMELLARSTAIWTGKEFGTPWQIFLTVQPWRVGEAGEIMLSALTTYPQNKNPHSKNPRIPRNAASPINFIEAIRVKEIQRLLRFGRDSNCPLAITVSSTLDGSNSISVTYSASWDHCNASAEWFCTQFEATGNQDGRIGLQVMSRNHS
jgi:hypothetical protein